MKPMLKFLRTTLVGGVVFLIPIVVLMMLLGKALALAHKLVDPLAEHLPVDSVIGVKTPVLLAIVLIVLFCFLAGFIARTVIAKQLVGRLESSVLSKLPGYEFLKGMSESLLGMEKTTYPVVMVRFDDTCQIGVHVDTLENGLVAVFIPDVPNPQSGALHLMTSDRVTPAGVPALATLKCLKRLGVGSRELLRGVPFGSSNSNH
jgi:uncharacterized membrane protein